MHQINNGFADYYYLTEAGEVYNITTEKYIKPDNNHIFRLKTNENKTKKISLRNLYKLVFNKYFYIDNISDLPDEQWKVIENTNNRYYISNKGRVKSIVNYNAKILKPNNQTGYSRVDIIQDDGSRRTKLISRLVAAAFLLPPASIEMQLHHIDGNKLNNQKDNLIWLTPKEHTEIHKEAKQSEPKTD